MCAGTKGLPRVCPSSWELGDRLPRQCVTRLRIESDISPLALFVPAASWTRVATPHPPRSAWQQNHPFRQRSILAIVRQGMRCERVDGNTQIWRLGRSDRPRRFEAVHTGHLQVHQDEVKTFSSDLVRGLFSICGRPNPVSGRFQHLRDQAAIHRAVFRNQNRKTLLAQPPPEHAMGRHRSLPSFSVSGVGTVNSNVLREPNWLGDSIVPPIRSTSRREITRPKPAGSDSVPRPHPRARSVQRATARLAAGISTPVSVIATRTSTLSTESDSSAAERMMLPLS